MSVQAAWKCLARGRQHLDWIECLKAAFIFFLLGEMVIPQLYCVATSPLRAFELESPDSARMSR